ncbi:MAG TPA: AraC family transcriptional regulator [Sphingopyxis sp.]|uniref:helix-turn-helix transcriptional regulator n=1 Tax=Sphingopyxis sp. TaxID=1908224 RepID=UPI002C1A9B05|nr:AraC family transcriptional regulator [Sphingopyxis sp.]HWW55260.1 AraC family transcriptional regulator [Sphingopyxis sp.]
MPDPLSPFRNSLLPVGVRSLAPHANPVTCVLAGRGGSLRLDRGDLYVEGEILLVRPGTVHAVVLPERGADVLYLSGMVFPFEDPLAQPLRGGLGKLAQDALGGGADAIAALRACLAARAYLPSSVTRAVEAIYADPMRRMSQTELAVRLGRERTQALRCFKAATGQVFREFKLWSALQYAAEQMRDGALVRTAAMDAGFADTAHLSRAFRRLFGLTPSAAIAGLDLTPSVDRDLRITPLM